MGGRGRVREGGRRFFREALIFQHVQKEPENQKPIRFRIAMKQQEQGAEETNRAVTPCFPEALSDVKRNS